MTTSIEIQLAKTDDLIDEVMSRFDHSGFIGMKVLSSVKCENGELQHFTARRYKGNNHAVMGLLADLSDYVLGEYINKVDNISDERAKDL